MGDLKAIERGLDAEVDLLKADKTKLLQDNSSIRGDIIRLKLAVQHRGHDYNLTRLLLRLAPLPLDHKDPVPPTEIWMQEQGNEWTIFPSIDMFDWDVLFGLWDFGMKQKRKPHCPRDDEVKQRIRAFQYEMSPQQAGTIVSEIIPTLRPVQGSKVIWKRDLVSGEHLMTVIPQQETLLLYDQMTQPNSRLFRYLVDAVLCPCQMPAFSSAQLIALALLALGGTADEASIQTWLMEHIAYFHAFKRRRRVALFDNAMRHGNLLNILWKTYSKSWKEPVFVSEFPTVNGLMDDEGARTRGLIWHLPSVNVNYLFEDLYEEIHVPFWRHPRPWSDSQTRTESRDRAPQLMDLPRELRSMIIQYVIPTYRTVNVRGHDKTFVFQDLPCNNLKGKHHHCERSHFLRIKTVLKFFHIPGLGRDMQADFFGTNTFSFEDVPVINGDETLEAVYTAQPFFKRMGSAALGAIKRVDLVLRIDLDWLTTNTKVSQWVLHKIGSKTQLTWLNLDIRCDGIADALGPSAIEHPVFRAVRDFGPVENLGLKLSEDIPGLEASLRRAIDLSFVEA